LGTKSSGFFSGGAAGAKKKAPGKKKKNLTDAREAIREPKLRTGGGGVPAGAPSSAFVRNENATCRFYKRAYNYRVGRGRREALPMGVPDEQLGR